MNYFERIYNNIPHLKNQEKNTQKYASYTSRKRLKSKNIFSFLRLFLQLIEHLQSQKATKISKNNILSNITICKNDQNVC